MYVCVQLYVGSLPATYTDDQLKQLFDQFGNVNHSAVVQDSVTVSQPGCCCLCVTVILLHKQAQTDDTKLVLHTRSMKRSNHRYSSITYERVCCSTSSRCIVSNTPFPFLAIH